MSMDLRGRILMDDSSAKTALNNVADAANQAADKIIAEFSRAKEFIGRTIGFVGLATIFDKSIEAASRMQALQATQATLLTNQGVASKYNLSISEKQYETNRANGQFTQDFYSKMLDSQATYLSIQTGINKAQLVQAQTLALTNSDIAKLVTAGPLVAGSLGAVNGPLHGIHQNFQLFLADATNLSATMAGGHGGSVTSSARMLGRILSDPARRMSAMTRYGFTLSQNEQMRIKTLESTNGLYAAQEAMLAAINNHIKDAAQNGTSPVERLKNDLQLVYTSLGQGLLPFFDALANQITGFVTSLYPLFKDVGDAFGQVLNMGGAALGTIITAIKPLIDLFTNSFLPALIGVLQPLLTLASAVLEPISKALLIIVGTGSGMNTLSGIFATMAASISKNLMVGVNAIAQAFQQMAKNGALTSMMKSLVGVFAALEPIIPNLALAFGNLLAAVAPLLVAMGPALVKVMQVWADLLVALEPALIVIIDAIAKLVTWMTGNKGLTQAIALLVAVWFTKSMFLTPIMAMGEGISAVIGKVIGLGGELKSVGGIIGSLGKTGGGSFVQRFKLAGEAGETGLSRLSTAHHLRTKRSEALSRDLATRAEQIEKARAERIATYKDKLENGMFKKHAAKMIEKLEKKEGKTWVERLTKSAGRDLEEVGKKGGKFGLLKHLFGFGGALGSMEVPKVATDQLSATNNLVAALVNLTNAINSGAMGGGGNSIENQVKDKIENKVKEEVKKKAEGKLKSWVENKVKGKLGNALKRFGKFGAGEAEAGGEAVAEGAGETALVGGGEAAAEGGILAAGAASGAATLGIGLAVAGVTVAYMKWHKQINHFIGQTAHHIWNGVKDVAKWGDKTAQNIAHHVANAGKAIVHFGEGVAKHAWDGAKHVAKFGMGLAKSGLKAAGTILHGVGSAIGGFFGGLFGGGGGDSHSGGNASHIQGLGKLKEMHFTGGALNVHIVSSSEKLGVAMARGIEKHKRPIASEAAMRNGGLAGIAAAEMALMVSKKRQAEHRGEIKVNIEPGSFVVNVHGSMDHATMKEVKRHVGEQFKELERSLKALGR